MIHRYMINYHKEEHIYDKEDMRTWELSHLELSYKSKLTTASKLTVLFVDILEIDNLHGMEKLEELRLDNNIITRMTGLDTLVNVRWLDLSFNLIETIEGLENLHKLTDLSLYSNRI